MLAIKLTEYINDDGFLTIEKNAPTKPGEGNGFLHTGIAIHALPEFPKEIVLSTLYRSLFKETPLLCRSPHKKNPDDDESVEDYLGALYIAMIMGNSWPSVLLEHFEKYGWDISIGKAPNLSDRFPFFPVCVRIAAGVKITAMEQLTLCFTVLSSIFSMKDADSNKRAYMRAVFADEFLLGKICATLWRFFIRRKYRTIGNSFAESFSDKEHPLISIK